MIYIYRCQFLFNSCNSARTWKIIVPAVLYAAQNKLLRSVMVLSDSTASYFNTKLLDEGVSRNLATRLFLTTGSFDGSGYDNK